MYQVVGTRLSNSAKRRRDITAMGRLLEEVRPECVQALYADREKQALLSISIMVAVCCLPGLEFISSLPPEFHKDMIGAVLDQSTAVSLN